MPTHKAGPGAFWEVFSAILAGTMQVKMGNAAVPAAAVGVAPTGQRAQKTNETVRSRRVRSARRDTERDTRTRVLPKTNCIVPAWSFSKKYVAVNVRACRQNHRDVPGTRAAESARFRLEGNRAYGQP